MLAAAKVEEMAGSGALRLLSSSRTSSQSWRRSRKFRMCAAACSPPGVVVLLRGSHHQQPGGLYSWGACCWHKQAGGVREAEQRPKVYRPGNF